MAQLTEGQRDDVYEEVMRYLSKGWIECSLNKAQLRVAITIFDEALETAESSILSNVSPAAQTWLLNNVSQARWIMSLVAEARTEVLGG